MQNIRKTDAQWTKLRERASDRRYPNRTAAARAVVKVKRNA